MTDQKKALKILLIALAVVVVLLIAVVLVISLNPQDAEQADTEDSGGISLISFDSEQFASAKIHTQNDDYTVTMINGQPSIEQLGKIEQNETALDQFLLDISSVTADSRVTNDPDDLALYGLDRPQYVEVVLNDQTKYRINAGNEAPLGGTYVSLEGEDTVYIIESGVTSIIKEKEQYVSLELIENPNKTDDEGNITIVNPYMITLSGAVRDNMSIMIDEGNYSGLSSSKYILPGFYDLPVNEVLASDIVSNLAPFSADSAVVVFPDDAALAKYGLHEPRSVISFMIEGDKHTISLGDKIDGEYYVTVDYIDCIFTVNEEYVPWAEVTMNELVSAPFFDPGVTKIQRMEFEYDIYRYVFEIKSELYGSDYAISEVLLNGEQFDIDRFKEIYTEFTQCTVLTKQQNEQDYNNELALIVDVYGNSDDITKEYEDWSFTYYKKNYNKDNYLYGLTYQGEISLQVEADSIDNLLKLLGELEQ